VSFDEIGGRNLLKGSLKDEDLQLLLNSIENGITSGGIYPQLQNYGLTNPHALQNLQHLQYSISQNFQQPTAIQLVKDEYGAPQGYCGSSELKQDSGLDLNQSSEFKQFKPDMNPSQGFMKVSSVIDGLPLYQSDVKDESLLNPPSCSPQAISPNQTTLCNRCGKEYLTKKHLYNKGSPADSVDTRCPNCANVKLAVDSSKQATRKNNKQKNYKCSFPGCPKMFITRKEQQNHIARHSNEKNFTCTNEGCHLAYTTKSSLDLHTTRIHGEKRYRCEFCDDAYAVRGDLNQHKKRKHSNQ